MIFRFVPVTAFVFILTACAEAPVPVEQQFLNSALSAIGGKENVETANTLAIEGQGSMQNVGQDMTPESAELKFTLSDYKQSIDLSNGSRRTEQVRTPQFTYFRGPDPMQQIFGYDGNVAYSVGPDGTARRAPDSNAVEQRSTYYHHPLPLLRAASLGSATVSNVRDEGGLTLADIATNDGVMLTMAIDSASGEPAFIRSTDHHAYFRDVVRQTNLSGYTSVGTLTLPSQADITLDEFAFVSMQLTSQEVNGDIGDLSAPAAAASAAPISGSAPANVVAEEVAEGVWFLAGQSHHSVLIEFSDHLMIVEAPNEIRTLAVVDKAAELVPGKPVRYLVNTHHHFDHSGGIRTAVSAGLTIVTHAANEAFYRRMAEQPSTLVRDTLSQQPQAISVETVDDVRVYEDDSMRVELHHIAGNPHSSSMLMAYLPAQGLIIEADAFSPNPGSPQRYAPNMLDNIQRLGLEIERIVPIHGGIGDFAGLEAHVQELRSQE